MQMIPQFKMQINPGEKNTSEPDEGTGFQMAQQIFLVLFFFYLPPEFMEGY